MIQATVCGHIGKAEFVESKNGDPFLALRVASNQYDYRKKEKVDTWVSVTIGGKKAATLAPFLQKGVFVVAAGDLRLETYMSRRDNREVTELRLWAQEVDWKAPPKTQERGHDAAVQPLSSFDDDEIPI